MAVQRPRSQYATGHASDAASSAICSLANATCCKALFASQVLQHPVLKGNCPRTSHWDSSVHIYQVLIS